MPQKTTTSSEFELNDTNKWISMNISPQDLALIDKNRNVGTCVKQQSQMTKLILTIEVAKLTDKGSFPTR